MKATIELTTKQEITLQPLFEAISLARTKTEKGSLLGQVWRASRGAPGYATFHFLTPAQALMVNKAIIEAMKIK